MIACAPVSDSAVARSAGAHSRIVAILKVGLPITALGLLAAVFLLEREDDFEGGLTFSEAEIKELSEGMKLSAPQLSGMTRDGDRYLFEAKEVLPDGLGLSKLKATNLEGSIEMGMGRSISIASDLARFDVTEQRMVLESGIQLGTSDGYTARALRIEADLRTATLVADGPVYAEGPIGNIEAGQLRIAPQGADQNQVIWFGNGVTLRYLPNAGGE